MLGTVNPSLESIAIEKLWSFFIIYSLMYPSSSVSGFTLILIIGCCYIAREHALIKKGNSVREEYDCLSYCLNVSNDVTSTSSENVKKGMWDASVIVFVIAFLIPVIFFNLFDYYRMWYLTYLLDQFILVFQLTFIIELLLLIFRL